MRCSAVRFGTRIMCVFSSLDSCRAQHVLYIGCIPLYDLVRRTLLRGPGLERIMRWFFLLQLEHWKTVIWRTDQNSHRMRKCVCICAIALGVLRDILLSVNRTSGLAMFGWTDWQTRTLAGLVSNAPNGLVRSDDLHPTDLFRKKLFMCETNRTNIPT